MALRGALVSYRTNGPTGRFGVLQDEWPYGALKILGEFQLNPSALKKFSTNPVDSERNLIEAECVVKFFYKPG